MQKFVFKDPREGKGEYYIKKIYESYGKVLMVEYSANPKFVTSGLTYLNRIKIIEDTTND